MGDLTKQKSNIGPFPLTPQYFQSSHVGGVLKSAGLMSDAQYKRWVDPLGIVNYKNTDPKAPDIPPVVAMPAPATDVASQVATQKKAAMEARGRTGRLSTILSQNDTIGGTIEGVTGNVTPEKPTLPESIPTTATTGFTERLKSLRGKPWKPTTNAEEIPHRKGTGILGNVAMPPKRVGPVKPRWI